MLSKLYDLTTSNTFYTYILISRSIKKVKTQQAIKIKGIKRKGSEKIIVLDQKLSLIKLKIKQSMKKLLGL